MNLPAYSKFNRLNLSLIIKLVAILQDYDLVIWSATSMKWIEEKMKLLGCDRHPGYRLAFYLDSRAMISIHSEKYGVVEVRKTISKFVNVQCNVQMGLS